MGVPKMIAQGGGTLLPLLLTGRLLLSHPSSISFSNFGSCRKTSVRFFTSMAAPPVAKKVRHEMEMFGDVRTDDYYWLRDDSRSDPEILSYLKEENDYTSQAMSGHKQLEDHIYIEMRGRIKEDDISTPIRRGVYYYYERTFKGKEYAAHCRRLITSETGISVYDVMPTGPGAPEEHIILDENIKAQGHDYYSIGAFKASPNNKLIAYAEDTKGNEIYSIYVIDADKGTTIGKPLEGVTSYIEWAGDDTLVYITMDEILRPDKVWSHKLLSEQSSDQCLYHEKDDMFSLDLQASESKQYLFVGSESKNTRFIFYLDSTCQDVVLRSLTPRVYGIDTSASHRGNHFFIKRRKNYHMDLGKLRVNDSLRNKIDSLDYAVVIVPFINNDDKDVDDLEIFCSVKIQDFQLYRDSMKTPPSVYDHDMKLGISVLKKRQEVLGGFEESDYMTERKWAIALDGTKVPVSILYKMNNVKLDGSDPLLLYGYGSYEACVDPSFIASRLSFVDRGFVYAIAHIRGGGEMGRRWYEDGKLLKKKNTFTDFIACAEYLIQNKYCTKEKLCINGRSAGGLLIGAVLNMRPDLFKAAVAGVPFVDVVTTMLDPTIPLTTSEWEEWGDPRIEEYYYYMKSYSPVDNVKAQNYPNILVTAGLNDPRVLYSEPAKYVAKLRATKTDDNLLLFKCELGAGHFSKSGRFEKLQEEAFACAFILKALDLSS
ncbi:hypothetical protein HPP92_022058 [Vanilla planifolia]|uniref:Prolyl endopeptidase n=1 Tax=Vanilla planifolia TaxID=51239 RepID=A0A835PR77_VANPL|nr:hypothetical protein HPP92_022058 [Vanilla planifolia]